MSLKNSKKDLLKLLTRTSIVGLAALSAANALGGVVTVDGAANHGETEATKAASWAENVVPDSGDTLTFGANNDQISINHAANVGAFEIDIAGKDAAGVNIGLGTAGHSITSIKGAHANKNLTLLAGGTDAFTVSATGAMNTLGLGTVDFNKQALTLTLAPGDGNAADYTGVTFQSTGGDEGTIAITDGTVTLGTFAAVGTAVDKLTIADKAAAVTSQDLVLATGVTLTGTGKLTIAGTKNVAAAISGSAADNGHLVFEGASKVDGAIANLNSITLGAGTVNFAENVTATTIHLGDNASEIVLADNKDITANVTTATDGEGKLTFQGVSIVTGKIGDTHDSADKALEQITLGDGEVTLANGSQMRAKTIHLGHDNSQLTLNASTIYGDITTANNTKGKLNFASGESVVNGKVAVAGTLLNEINVGVGAKATVTFNGDVEGDINLKHDASVVKLGSGGTINGAILPNNSNTGTLTFVGDSTVKKNVGALGSLFQNITVNENSSATLEDTAHTTSITLNEGAVLSIAQNVVGNIKGAGAGQGTLEIAGNVDLTGAIGPAGATLKEVSFTGDHTLILDSDATATAFTTATKDTGAIEIDGADVAITGDIGVDNQLKAVNVVTKNALTLKGNAYTKDGINVADAGGALVIDTAKSVVNKIKGVGALKINNGQSVKVTESLAIAKIDGGAAANEGTLILADGVGTGAAQIGQTNALANLQLEGESVIGGDVSVYKLTGGTILPGAANKTITLNTLRDKSTSSMSIKEHAGNTFDFKVAFQENENSTAILTGNNISVKGINLVGKGGANATEQVLQLGSDNLSRPQIVKVGGNNITGTDNGQTLEIDIAGPTYLSANITNKIDYVNLIEKTNFYYAGNNSSQNLSFDEDATMYLFAGNHTIASDMDTPNDTSHGAIIASGVTAADAEAAFMAGEALDLSAKKYNDTVALSGVIGSNAHSQVLDLVDVGNGTLKLTGGGDVNIGVAKAKKLHLEGGTYNISSAETEELHFAGNSTIAANSTLLGTKSKHLESELTFDPGGVTLTLGDNVDLHIQENGSDRISGAGNSLTFKGKSNVYSQLGISGSKFANITLSQNTSDVTFEDDMYLNNLALNHADAKATIHGNIHGNVSLGADNNGTLIVYGDSSEIASIGAGFANNLGELVLHSNKTSVEGTFQVRNISFKEDGELIINAGAANTAITGDITGYDTGTLIVKGGNLAFNNVGTKGWGVKAVKMGSGTSKLELNAGKAAYTHIYGPGAGAGVFNFKGDSDSPELVLGKDDDKLAEVSFAGDVTFKDAYATKFTPNANSITFRKAVGRTDLSGGATANVLEGGHIAAKGAAVAAGIVNIKGAGIEMPMAGERGAPLAQLNVNTRGASVKVQGDIYANALNHKDATVSTASDTILSGNYVADNAHLDLGGSFAVKGNTTLSNTISVDNVAAGTVLNLKDSANVDISGLSGLMLALDARKGSSIEKGRKIINFNSNYEDVDGNAFKNLLAKTTISTNHLFRSVKLDVKGDSAYLLVDDATDEAVSSLNIPETQRAPLTAVLKDNNELADDIGNAANPTDAAKRYASTEESIEKTTAVIGDAMNEVANQATGRLNDLVAATFAPPVSNQPAGKLKASAPLGVAAGDASEKFGLWGRVTGGTAQQKTRKLSSAYNSSSFGSVVGIDTMLDDKTIVGFAVANTSSNVKFKGTKSGDKLKSNSWMFSGYGSYSFYDNFFVRAGLTASSNKISSREKRIGDKTGTANANAKYTAEALNAEIGVGYNYIASDGGVFTPSVGLRLTRVNDIEFKETGAGIQNKHVKHKASAKTAALLGAQYTNNVSWDDMVFTPEAHVNLQYGIGVKTPKGEFKPLSSTNMTSYVGQRAANFAANIGTSLTTYVDNIEYGAGYDLNLSDKYRGHQGSLKVKIKF